MAWATHPLGPALVTCQINTQQSFPRAPARTSLRPCPPPDPLRHPGVPRHLAGPGRSRDAGPPARVDTSCLLPGFERGTGPVKGRSS